MRAISHRIARSLSVSAEQLGDVTDECGLGLDLRPLALKVARSVLRSASVEAPR
jgi:hypothetical protein